MAAFANTLYWLYSVLCFTGVVGGLSFLTLAVWLVFSKFGKAIQHNINLHEERRCRDCKECYHCDAAYTGVAFPCPYFGLDEKGDKPQV